MNHQSNTDASQRWLAVLIVVAVVLRAGVRLAGGEAAFLTNGYTFYLTIADSLLAGDGLCYGPGESCAVRLPLYSLFVAGFRWLDVLYPGVVLAQAVIGGVTVWLSWWLGQRLFSPAVGLLAAAAAALNPYAVFHDTALQDTALLNLLMLGAVCFLVKAERTQQAADWLAGGAALGLSVLTSGRVVPLIPIALVWVLAGGVSWRRGARNSLILLLPVVLFVGGWVVRNWRVAGRPVLTTVSEESLFLANSPLMFAHFPEQSIDLSTGDEWRLAAEERRRLAAVEGPGAARDRLLREMTLAYVTAHPVDVAVGVARKLWVVASAQLSPAREPLLQWGYRLVFLPIHLLALAGAWGVRHRWREHAWPGLFVAAFLLTTAIYWAHTSHKSLIDTVVFVYAAAGVLAIGPARVPR